MKILGIIVFSNVELRVFSIYGRREGKEGASETWRSEFRTQNNGVQKVPSNVLNCRHFFILFKFPGGLFSSYVTLQPI